MAVDTQAKRMSALNIVTAAQSVLPIPDSSVAEADRQHLGRMYAGISTASTGVSAATLHQSLSIGIIRLSL